MIGRIPGSTGSDGIVLALPRPPGAVIGNSIIPRNPASTSRTTVQPWKKWIESWYVAYALQGVIVAGLIPILLPLLVSSTGTAAHIGLVMAAFNLGGLTAPVWGTLADHYRLHRWLLSGGTGITAVGLAAFAISKNPVLWFGLALLQGIGAASAATVANLFIVETHPHSEWDERIGWLQTFYGGGQVAGLVLAGIVSQVHLRLGLLLAAGLSATALVLGWLTTKTPPGPLAHKPVLRHPPLHGEWAIISPQRLFHHVNLATLRQLKPALRSPFGLFIAVWLLALAGSSSVFSLYPVFMQQVFNLKPGPSSVAFAVAAGLGLLLYSPAGTWTDRFGPLRLLQTGLGMRVLALLILLGLALAHFGSGWLSLPAFTLIVLAWSLLIVSGTVLATQLSPVGEGAGIGIFNASSAVANVFGATLGGWAADHWGYSAVLVVAMIGVGLGLALSFTTQTNTRPGDGHSKM